MLDLLGNAISYLYIDCEEDPEDYEDEVVLSPPLHLKREDGRILRHSSCAICIHASLFIVLHKCGR